MKWQMQRPGRYLAGNAGGIFVLTNPAAGLTYTSDDELPLSKGITITKRMPQVYTGGAAPLGELPRICKRKEKSFKLLDAAREAKSSRAFLFMGLNYW